MTKKVFAISDLCTGCRTCEIACAVAHSQSKTLEGAILEVPIPRYRIEVLMSGENRLPLNCRQCDEPDCLYACKAGAITKIPDTGKVKVDKNKCVGCWMCVMVCPFGAAHPDEDRHRVLKCGLCGKRENGPACVEACPTNALFFGTYEEFSGYLDKLKGEGIRIKIA